MNPTSLTGRLLALGLALRTAWAILRRRGAGPPDGSAGDSDVAAGNGHRPPDVDDPSRREVPENERVELWVSGLLFAAAGCACAFVVFYVVAKFDTQLLGLSIGIGLFLLAAAIILAGKLVVPQEISVEPRGTLLDPEAVAEVAELVHEGGEGVTRRKLLVCAGCAAGGAITVAAGAPLASLGPPPAVLHHSPWQRGVKMVTEEGGPLIADQIQIGSFYTGLPLGRDWETFASGLLVIRLPESMIHLPPERATWTPRGIMAFSKICTHAGCAISLYRYPLYAPDSTDVPAFTCPCHYSTFAPGEGGRVIFGPAGRQLPQLPVMIDDDGHLAAAGQFDESIGPAWWGTRRV